MQMFWIFSLFLFFFNLTNNLHEYQDVLFMPLSSSPLKIKDHSISC